MATLDHTVAVKVKRTVPAHGDEPETTREFFAFLSGMGPAVRSMFVKLAKQSAWEALEEERPTMSAPRYLRLEAATLRDMQLGKYDWGGENYNEMIQSEKGFRLLLEARLRVGTHELPDGFIDDMIAQYGWEKIFALENEADGGGLPNGSTPEPDRGSQSTTKDLSAKSVNGSPARTRESSPALPTG